jgi:hypothetical protein
VLRAPRVDAHLRWCNHAAVEIKQREGTMHQKRAALAVVFVVVATAVGVGQAAAQGVDPSLLPVTVGRAGIADEDFVKIAGEIRNASPDWVCTPRVEVELVDASGKSLVIESIVTATMQERGKAAIDGTVAQRTFLPPGEVAVFEYTRDVKKIAGKYASQRVTARARKCESQPKVMLEGFVAKKDKDGWYSVSGSVKNVGSVGCRSPKAVIGCYQADGKLYGADSAQPDQTFQKMLPPGQSVPFSIKAIDNPGGNTITDVRAWADCELPE